MKKILILLTMLIFLISSLAIAFAQPRQRKRNTINRGVTRAGGQQQSAIGAGGAGTSARNRRGSYVTRNGKRIWVPQGSPAVGNRSRVFEKDQFPVGIRPPTRRVYEKEQLQGVRKNKSTNTNRP